MYLLFLLKAKYNIKIYLFILIILYIKYNITKDFRSLEAIRSGRSRSIVN